MPCLGGDDTCGQMEWPGVQVASQQVSWAHPQDRCRWLYESGGHTHWQQHLAKICGEITRNYDVDGIHLDYIRYPENWNIKVSRDKGTAIYHEHRTENT